MQNQEPEQILAGCSVVNILQGIWKSAVHLLILFFYYLNNLTVTSCQPRLVKLLYYNTKCLPSYTVMQI